MRTCEADLPSPAAPAGTMRGAGGRALASLRGAALALLLAGGASPAAALEEAVAVITDIAGAPDASVRRGGQALKQGLLARLQPGDVVSVEPHGARVRIHTSAQQDVVVEPGRPYVVPSAPRLGTLVNVVRLLFGTLDNDRRVRTVNATTRGEAVRGALPPSVARGTARVVARPGPLILPFASAAAAPGIVLVAADGRSWPFQRQGDAAYRIADPVLAPGAFRIEVRGADGRLIQEGRIEAVAVGRVPPLAELAPRETLGPEGADLVAAAQLAVVEDGAWLLESLRRLDRQRQAGNEAAAVLMRRLEAGAGLSFLADAAARR